MSDVLERFMRYVQIDSQSDPDNMDETPSTPRQHEMARYLGEELREIGCADVVVDEHAYVTGALPASAGAEKRPALLLCAHLDSSPDAPAAGVRPHVVRYEGGPLVAGIVDGEPVQTTPEQVSDLNDFIGQDIVCTDGTTLLSADDKAGVAEICALLARLAAHSELPHPRSRWPLCQTRRSVTAPRCSTSRPSAPGGATPWTARPSGSSTTSASRPARPRCACAA